MKNLYQLLFFIFFCFFFSCKKEDARYIYPEKELITVKGLEPNYVKISAVDKIEINPEVSSNKEGELEYLWGIYQKNVQLANVNMDTIGRAKELNYLVKEFAEQWVLVLRVTNKKTGYAQYFSSTVMVGTQFTRGWYVLKDENEKTDLDLFLTPSNYKPASKVENVYSTMNGKKLDGKASLIRFNSFYKSETNGKFDNTRSLFLISEKDASVVKVSDLKEIFDLNNLIFGGVSVKKPGLFGMDFLTFFMTNNGQLHSMIGQGYSFGKFGGRKIKGVDDAPYSLSKYHLMFISSYFFDELSSSFVSSTDRNLNLVPVVDNPGTQLKANNNNKTLIYMGMKSRSPLGGFAIFQDKTDPAQKTLAQVFPITQNFRMTTTNLLPTQKIYNGDNFSLLFEDENMIYFSVGKEVWSRNLSNQFEQLQFTVPTDETITFIRHRKNNGTGAEAPFAYNYVIVGTSTSSGNYKVRMFTKTSGNLSTEPLLILEGKGNPRDVVYVSPGVSTGTTTFPDTF